MAFRWLIYSTGTTYSDTIVRESATDNPGGNEASLYSEFVIPEIQPLYLWRVTGDTTVVPNTDSNIYDYLQSIAPPPEPEDDASVGFVTGITATKIDKVTGATGNLGTFDAEGNLVDVGLTPAQLSGLTTYTFVESGGTTITTDGNEITIYSATPTGTTVAWGDITGTLSNQTDLQNALNAKLDASLFNTYTGDTQTLITGIDNDITYLSGQTDTKLNITDFNIYTGATQPVIDAALTGVTNLGTGTTLGATSGRNITLKSISVLGGLSLSGDADNLILSGGSSGGGAWGTITGTLSNQTDLWTTLTGMTAETATKLDTAVFNTYTGDTQTTITGIENDITYLSGQTDLKLNITDFNVYSGATDTRIGDIEDDVQVLYDESLINITGATNGLTKVGSKDVRLGGTLTQSTVITDSQGTPVGIVYGGDYSATFTNESLITKRYADAIAAGFRVKDAVLVATTGDTALSGLTTIDGITLSNGDRVLVKNNTDASENGIYVATGGTWSRSTDYDGNPGGEVASGDLIPVMSGDTQYSTLWALVTADPITVGTTNLNYTLFSSPHEMQAGTGINISGNEISVDGASLAGSSITWTGDTFNVDVTTGTVAAALNLKLDITDFNTYTGDTQTTITGIENDITYLSGQTDTKLDVTTFTGYTATTGQEITDIENDITYISGVTDTKLDTSAFNTYTGDTAPNELFLTHTGGTELNTVAATAIDWDTMPVSGSAFNFSGGSDVFILEADDYEVSYNIPFVSNSNKNIAIGANLILNNSTVIDLSATADWVAVVGAAGSVGLPTIVLTLAQNDKLTLAVFRTGAAGSVTSKLTGSVLIKKKNTLQ